MPSISAPVLAGVAVAGAAASAVGTISQGIAASNAANYQAQVAANDAQEAGQNALYAKEAGQQEAQTAGRRAAAELGAERAAIAADNVDTNSGSALKLQVSQRETGLQSQENVVNNSLLQAYGFQTQQTGYQAQSQLQQSEAASAIPGSLLSAAGKLGESAGTLPDKFSWMGSGGTVDSGTWG